MYIYIWSSVCVCVCVCVGGGVDFVDECVRAGKLGHHILTRECPTSHNLWYYQKRQNTLLFHITIPVYFRPNSKQPEPSGVDDKGLIEKPVFLYFSIQAKSR